MPVEGVAHMVVPQAAGAPAKTRKWGRGKVVGRRWAAEQGNSLAARGATVAAAVRSAPGPRDRDGRAGAVGDRALDGDGHIGPAAGIGSGRLAKIPGCARRHGDVGGAD